MKKIQVSIKQADYQTVRKYWNKLKERLKKEGSESVIKCHRLKLKTVDGENYLTDFEREPVGDRRNGAIRQAAA
ncbi:MAG: hypothetical protein K0B01_08020 [Syntrophobacterales bacterium]|nr:hypothetical protein [Syntrophobacterales bacterium]